MRYFILILSLFLAGAAYAQQDLGTFTYQHGEVNILRASPPPPPSLPWKPDAPMPISQPVITFEVDIRPSDSLYRQKGWINTGSLFGNSGMLFLFETPQVATLKAMQYYQPVDVLWIDNTGIITSIMPNLSLPDIKKPVSDPKPSKAILLLAGGTVQMESINPGDKLVQSDYFQVLPKVLTITP